MSRDELYQYAKINIEQMQEVIKKTMDGYKYLLTTFYLKEQLDSIVDLYIEDWEIIPDEKFEKIVEISLDNIKNVIQKESNISNYRLLSLYDDDEKRKEFYISSKIIFSNVIKKLQLMPIDNILINKLINRINQYLLLIEGAYNEDIDDQEFIYIANDCRNSLIEYLKERVDIDTDLTEFEDKHDEINERKNIFEYFKINIKNMIKIAERRLELKHAYDIINELYMILSHIDNQYNDNEMIDEDFNKLINNILDEQLNRFEEHYLIPVTLIRIRQ